MPCPRHGLRQCPARPGIHVPSAAASALGSALQNCNRTSNAAEEPQAVRPLFKQRQKVRIVTGAFATLEAVFDIAEGGERATVLLELLGRQSRVRVGVGEIVNAD